jgi:opacity protein-like surface antigen
MQKTMTRHICKIILATSIVFLFFSTMGEGGTFRIKPSFTVSEEYNDNFFLDEENKKDEYITRVLPSIMLEYKAPLWEWDVEYLLDYRYYARQNRGDEITHDLDAKGHISLIRDLFFVDISDDYRRASLDITRDFTKESLFLNQSDRNIFNVNPYFVWRLSPRVNLTTGYIYANYWYEEDIGVDKQDNIAYADMEFELTPKWKVNAGYKYTLEETDARDFNKDDAYLGSRYEYAEESYLHFRAGNTWLDFEEGGGLDKIFWSAGIVHKFKTSTGSFETARDYDENPRGNPLEVDRYVVSFRTVLKRASFGASASLREFTDTVTGKLETRSYGAGGDIRYELTPKATCLLDFAFDKFERKLADAHTRRYLVGLGIEYKFLEDFWMTFTYRYTDSESPNIAGDNFENNRYILAIKKTF